MKKLKIIHLSDQDIGGGSSYYAYRMHNFMQRINKINSKLLVLKKNSKDTSVESFNIKFNNHFRKKLFFLFLRENNKYSFYNYGNYLIKELYQIKKILDYSPHVIIIYNNSNFIHPKIISILCSKNIKIFFYFMDMEFITGGCHYNFECSGFKNKCNNCPAVKLPLKSLPNKILNEKIRYLFNKKINFITPNNIVYKNLYKSTLFNRSKHSNHKIYLGLNLNNYKPKKIKNFNNLIRISFRSSLNPRKGNHLLIDALNYLASKGYNLHNKILFNILGDSSILEFLRENKYKFKFQPIIKREKQLIKFYQESDFFLSQSIQDLGPIMINESLACGVPVISFKIGIAKDIVKNGYNGFLIKNISPNLLGNELIKISKLNQNKLNKLKANARQSAKKSLNIKKQVDKILQLSK